MPYVSAENGEAFVHLAYLDETGTDGHSPIVMFGALIVPHGSFGRLENLHNAAIQQILPLDKIDEFTEFHASQLYEGKGPFEGIDEEKRIRAIQVLLAAVTMEKLPFVYAAVDRKKFSHSPFCWGKPLHLAFHMCLLGVEDWATANHPNPYPQTGKLLDWKDICLYILDDCDDKQLKDQFRKSYRALRVKNPFTSPVGNRLWHAHDDMFFGDSKDCLGIQISDSCNFFVRRHLAEEPEPHNLYAAFCEQVICAKPESEWTTYKSLCREHRVVDLNHANAKGQTA